MQLLDDAATHRLRLVAEQPDLNQLINVRNHETQSVASFTAYTNLRAAVAHPVLCLSLLFLCAYRMLLTGRS